MTFDEIKARIAKLEADAQQAAGQLNMAMGAWNEAKAILAYMEQQAVKAVEAVKGLASVEVAAPVAPVEAPVEAVTPTEAAPEQANT